MKTRQTAWTLVALGTGFMLGRLGHGERQGNNAGGGLGLSAAPGEALSRTTRVEETGEEAPAVARPRRERQAATVVATREKPSEPRVSIPWKTVAGLLKEELAYSDFVVLGRNMEKALTMLGASEQEKKDVMAAIDKNQAEILAEEKTHVQVASSDGSRLTLDLSGMEEPARRIAGQLQEDLRAALPADLAEALIGSMDLERYYFRGQTRETSFRITRGDSGGLMATQTTGGGSNGSGIQPKEFPDDGTPIPAAAVFDKRWSWWLEGVALQPPPKP